MNNMTRRAFVKVTGMGATALVTAGSVLATLGCDAQSVFTKMLAYVNVGLQAFQSVVNLLAGAGVINLGAGSAITAVINLVKVGFADLQTAVNDYLNAPADQKATLLGKISTVIAILQNDIAQFWNNLSIPDSNLAALVQGLIGVIVTTLAGFAASIPAPPASVKKVAAKGFPVVTPVKRSVKQFKADFNALLHNAGKPQYELR